MTARIRNGYCGRTGRQRPWTPRHPTADSTVTPSLAEPRPAAPGRAFAARSRTRRRTRPGTRRRATASPVPRRRTTDHRSTAREELRRHRPRSPPRCRLRRTGPPSVDQRGEDDGVGSRAAGPTRVPSAPSDRPPGTRHRDRHPPQILDRDRSYGQVLVSYGRDIDPRAAAQTAARRRSHRDGTRWSWCLTPATEGLSARGCYRVTARAPRSLPAMHRRATATGATAGLPMTIERDRAVPERPGAPGRMTLRRSANSGPGHLHGAPDQLGPRSRGMPACDRTRAASPELSDQRHDVGGARAGRATMKFACFGDTRRAPDSRAPSRPRPRSAGPRGLPRGFVNTLPQFGSASGWVRRRHSRASSIAARIAPAVARSAAGRAAPTTTRPPPSPTGGRRSRPRRPATDRPSPPEPEDLDPLRRPRRSSCPWRAGVHPHRAAGRRRDRHAELETASRAAGRPRRAAGSGIDAAGGEHVAVPGAHGTPRPSRSTSPGNPSSATRTFEPFPRTTTGTPDSAIARPRRGGPPRTRAPGTARPDPRSGTS